MTLLELSCKRLASLETLEVLTKARPSIPEDATALSALWQSYCVTYGDEGHFMQFLRSGTADAFHVGCKFQLLLRYITTEKMLPCSVEMALCSSHCSLELFELICSSLGKYPLRHHASWRDVGGTSCVSLASQFETAAIVDRSLLSAKLNHLVSNETRRPISFGGCGVGGRSVLHVALEQNFANDDVFRLLSDEYDEEILFIRHPKTGLFSFQMASLASCDASLSTVYSMLRSAPLVLGEFQHSVTANREETFETAIDNKLAEDMTFERVWSSPALEHLIATLDSNMHSQLVKMLSCSNNDPAWNQMIGAAAAFQCPPKLMEVLMELHPEMLHQPDSNGWLPLHHAVMSQQGEDAPKITLIVEAYPAACHHRDRNGYLPFHLACCSGKSVWILEKLLEYNPQALEQVDSIFRLPPAFLAAQSGRATLSTVFHLLTRTPEVVVPHHMDLDGI